MKKITIALLIIVLVTGYITGFIYDPFIFFPIMLLILYVAALYAILLFIINIILRFLLPNIVKQYEKNKRKLKVIILTCTIFFFFGTWAINHYCLPHKLHPISLTANLLILLFTIFLGWSLVHIRRKKLIIFIGITIFALSMFLLTHVSSKTFRYLEPSPLDVLKSLPYLTWVPVEKDKNIEKIGVTIYKSNLSYQGINVYVYADDTMTYLIDMLGETLHNWSSGTYQLSHVEMYYNGDLLGIAEDDGLIKLDWNSNVKWVRKMRFHHDVAIAGNKNIYAIARKDELVLCRGLPLPILNDYILVLNSNGEVKREISLFKILKDEIPPYVFTKIYSWIIRPYVLLEILEHKIIKHFAFKGWFLHPPDIFHANTVEIIDRDIEGFCRKGNLLICVRNFNLIGILDVEKEELIWQWGPGDLRMPHHPTILENGNILIFDNGWERKYSRIVELNPVTKKIVWEYKSDPPKQFFSLRRGANQRLPNGNTLITESDKGHVFEVTQDGEIVWEFYSTDIKDGKRKAIYRMMRIIDPENYPCLGTLD